VRRSCILLGCALVGACTIEPRVDREVVEPPDSSSVFIRVWSDAPPAGVRSGDLVWVWGTAGTAPGAGPPRLVPGGVGPETRQALENVLAVLAAGGATPSDVAQCSIFVTDSADVAPVREIYAEYFATAPRRTAIVAGGLGLDARVEIECTAVAPPAR
jgi:enamine deaminase RidA (YjgF/YER057c/UK114 family)